MSEPRARVIEESRVIAAGPRAVWEDLAAPGRFAEWFAFCDEVHVPDAPATWVLIGSWGAQRSAVTVHVTERTAPSLLRYEHVEEVLGGRPARRLAIDSTMTFELAPHGDGGTEVTITSRQVPAGLLAGLMIRLFGGRAIKGMLEQSLETLAHRHQTGSDQGDSEQV